MKKYFRSVVLAVVLFTSAGGLGLPAYSVAGVPQAVSYLQTQPQDPWVTLALVAAGQTTVSKSHLTSVAGNLATDYAKTILALVAAGENPRTFGSVDYVAALKNLHTASQMGDVNLLNDDAWSIIALAAVNQSSSAQAQDAKQFLLLHQNDDGGWGFAVGGNSDSNDTAAAVMALLEVGLSAGSTEITEALGYLHAVQNDDGGFGYDVDSASDSGSGAWVVTALNKLNIDPASWAKSGGTPLTQLASLQDTDGGYWWLTLGSSTFNNKAMSAFVVVALSDASFPVVYEAPLGEDPTPTTGKAKLRIEGGAGTLCVADVDLGTALQAIERAATSCGYTFTVTQTAFGPYVSQIGSDAAQGLNGWLYLVDYVSPPVGASEYNLEAGDELLWWYGEWNWPGTRLRAAAANVDEGQSIALTAEYFNGTDWLPLPGATIVAGTQEFQANATGQLTTSLPAGAYTFVVEHSGYIRSASVTVQVGDGVGQTVGLLADIRQGTVAGDSIAFEVTPGQLNFGVISPGATVEKTVTLTNEGRPVRVSARVSGENVFAEALRINAQPWVRYENALARGQEVTANVSLTIPAAYLGSGLKQGELVFWAVAE